MCVAPRACHGGGDRVRACGVIMACHAPCTGALDEVDSLKARLEELELILRRHSAMLDPDGSSARNAQQPPATVPDASGSGRGDGSRLGGAHAADGEQSGQPLSSG